MKVVYLAPVLVALAACMSPLEACKIGASEDLNVVRDLIAQSEATLERGYRYETRQRQVVFTDFCIGGGHNSGSVKWCNRSEPNLERIPVAMALSAEREKLKHLRLKEKELSRRAALEIQKCELAHA